MQYCPRHSEMGKPVRLSKNPLSQRRIISIITNCIPLLMGYFVSPSSKPAQYDVSRHSAYYSVILSADPRSPTFEESQLSKTHTLPPTHKKKEKALWF